VNHQFKDNVEAVFDRTKPLTPFEKYYKLPEKNEDELSRHYLLRCISLINRKQNEFLGEELNITKTSTLHMVEQIKEREAIIQDQVLDQFCRAIVTRNPGILSDIDDAKTLQDKAKHWRDQLKENGSKFIRLNMSWADLKRLPDEISYFTALTHLYLTLNKLQTLPESFGSLNALTELHLFKNQLQTLPESFGSLNALNELYLSYNQLQTLPESFGSLSALTLLDLRNNKLQTLPDSFSRLNALTFLDLRSNKLQNLSSEVILNFFGKIKNNGCSIIF